MLSRAILFGLLFLLGCNTPAINRFSEVKVGMYKGEVLDLVGSPVDTQFRNDEYIWSYRFHEGDKMVSKEVRVRQDYVTYVGEPKEDPKDRFSGLHVGMTKSIVLDELGLPQKTLKKSSEEIWYYGTKDKPNKWVMEIHFKGEKMTSSAPYTEVESAEPPPTTEKTDDKSDKGFQPVE